MCVYFCALRKFTKDTHTHTQKKHGWVLIIIFGWWEYGVENILLCILQFAFIYNLYFLHNHLLLYFKIIPQVLHVNIDHFILFIYF